MDGLKYVNMLIKSICNVVKYVRYFPLRLRKFKKCVKCEEIENQNIYLLGCPSKVEFYIPYIEDHF